MSIMHLKTYKRSFIKKYAKFRKPGYVEAIMEAAVSYTDTHVTLDAKDAKRITDEYGGGVPITRQPTDAEKAMGGCAPCAKGKSKMQTARNMDQWHKAMEIPE